ncbi:class I SAM-dependent methyltransferase [Fulvivirga sp. 29W222]|uniref:Class I SAM-dependent methyltransferase n=1 Tax=Fulvivirga marina TaxID=2494733 RepID=A0A937G348_9BACT|nr:class I SAM-dependent methyltransferase [Fulvivirga marina]MBL6449817.1 class I SAM-dependent methyltransferase [Fulvivirga marina]
MTVIKEWFGQWFDSPYYHILYKHRDHEEASEFIDNLVEYFHISKDHKLLDLACGKGRHSIYLNRKGFDVVGVDLSAQNIEHAKQFENNKLHFFIQDMRHDFAENEFDFVLNMFTSFGYFDSDEENAQAVQVAADALKPGGKLLIDFLNPYKVVHNLVPSEEKQIEGITFQIAKQFSEDGYILKDIRFEDNGHEYHYQEKVKAIRRVEFLSYFQRAGLQLVEIFGDYHFKAYDPEHSERMIFVVKK